MGGEAIFETHPLGRKTVDIGRFRHLAAIATKAAQALLVGVDEKKVRRFHYV